MIDPLEKSHLISSFSLIDIVVAERRRLKHKPVQGWREAPTEEGRHTGRKAHHIPEVLGPSGVTQRLQKWMGTFG